MKVIDLTRAYLTHVIQDDNFFRYENVYPELFEHYYRYWAPRQPHHSIYSEADITRARDLLIASLKKLYKRLTEFDAQVKSAKIVLFVGDKTSNGHAFHDGEQFVVWLPVECYTNELDADIFITHELIHSLHYSNTSDFYFTSRTEKASFSRQLITEGIASYLTSAILEVPIETALWGAYLSQTKLEKWFEQCRLEYNHLIETSLELYNTSEGTEFFQANDENDIYRYRAGYYIGYRLIESFCQDNNIAPARLLQLSSAELTPRLFEQLSALAVTPS